ATLHLLPTLWLRNTWSWGRVGQEGYWPRGRIDRRDETTLTIEHPSCGTFVLAVEPPAPQLLFTHNETNFARLFGATNPSPYVKDAFHRYLIAGEHGAVNPAESGTKVAGHYRLELPAGGSATIRLRFSSTAEAPAVAFGPDFESTFALRIAEADEFYADLVHPGATDADRHVLQIGR